MSHSSPKRCTSCFLNVSRLAHVVEIFYVTLPLLAGSYISGAEGLTGCFSCVALSTLVVNVLSLCVLLAHKQVDTKKFHIPLPNLNPFLSPLLDIINLTCAPVSAESMHHHPIPISMNVIAIRCDFCHDTNEPLHSPKPQEELQIQHKEEPKYRTEPYQRVVHTESSLQHEQGDIEPHRPSGDGMRQEREGIGMIETKAHKEIYAGDILRGQAE